MTTAKVAASSKDRVKAYLTSLQVWQLKHLAINTGLSTGGNKGATADALLAGLHTPHNARQRSTIYKSVDMGVKNLAFCVIEPATASSTYKLLDWQRLNVLTADKATNALTSTDAEEETEESTASTASLYSPSNLAPAASRLATRLATTHSPSAILIERQRYRSAGGSAVQEWTLRVNSLEAMLWASLETMRVQKARSTVDTSFPATVEMNPSRIAAFWNARGRDWSLEGGEENLLPEEGSKSKRKAIEGEAKRGMEKAEKIALIRRWLEGGDVDVVKAVQPLANAFMATGRAKKGEGDAVVGKKDDLADCVVQGVTFGIWERNRELLRRQLEAIDD